MKKTKTKTDVKNKVINVVSEDARHEVMWIGGGGMGGIDPRIHYLGTRRLQW
jgi:hypothetical protein